MNRGDLISRTKGAAGGILCLVNHNDNEFIGCESYGRVISDRPDNDYKGTFFGQCKKPRSSETASHKVTWEPTTEAIAS